MRMLIVDDSRTMRNFLAALADELNFKTLQACDGREALVRLNEGEPFDIINEPAAHLRTTASTRDAG